MANPKYFNRVLVATTTIGPGTLSLGAAPPGYQDYSDAGATSSDTVGYEIVDDLTNPTQWEIGEGVWTAGSPATLTRATIIGSTNGGLAVNWGTGTKYVFSVDPAERKVIGPKATVVNGNLVVWDGTDGNHLKEAPDGAIPTAKLADASVTTAKLAAYRGALVRISADQSIPDTTATALTWDTEDLDTDTIHDTVSNTSRLTVPTGVTCVRLIGNVQFAANGTGVRQAFLNKNGASFNYRPNVVANNLGASNSVDINLSSPPLTVVATDYFELVVSQTSGASLNVNGGASVSTWFAMEIIR